MQQRLYGNMWKLAHTEELWAGSFGRDKPQGNMLMVVVRATLLLISIILQGCGCCHINSLLYTLG